MSSALREDKDAHVAVDGIIGGATHPGQTQDLTENTYWYVKFPVKIDVYFLVIYTEGCCPQAFTDTLVMLYENQFREAAGYQCIDLGNMSGKTYSVNTCVQNLPPVRVLALEAPGKSIYFLREVEVYAKP